LVPSDSTPKVLQGVEVRRSVRTGNVVLDVRPQCRAIWSPLWNARQDDEFGIDLMSYLLDRPDWICFASGQTIDRVLKHDAIEYRLASLIRRGDLRDSARQAERATEDANKYNN